MKLWEIFQILDNLQIAVVKIKNWIPNDPKFVDIHLRSWFGSFVF